MTFTFKDMVDQVVANTGRKDKDSTVKIGLNFGLDELCKSHKFSCMFREYTATLSSGSQTLDVNLGADSNFAQIISVVMLDATNSYNLDLKTKDWVDANYPATTSMTPGKPLVAYLVGTQLSVFPPADADYQLRVNYRVNPSRMIYDNDTPSLPDCASALIAYATRHVLLAIGKLEEAQFWHSEYLRLANVMIADDTTKINASHKFNTSRQVQTRQEYLNRDPLTNPFIGQPMMHNL